VRELLVVLALGLGLGLILMTFVVATGGIPHGATPRRDRTVLDIAMLENGLKLYRARTGHLPDSTTGFAALLDVQIIDRMPKDAWGNPYRYELVDGRPVITSFGADGLPGGDGVNADLSNRSPELSAR